MFVLCWHETGHKKKECPSTASGELWLPETHQLWWSQHSVSREKSLLPQMSCDKRKERRVIHTIGFPAKAGRHGWRAAQSREIALLSSIPNTGVSDSYHVASLKFFGTAGGEASLPLTPPHPPKNNSRDSTIGGQRGASLWSCIRKCYLRQDVRMFRHGRVYLHSLGDWKPQIKMTADLRSGEGEGAFLIHGCCLTAMCSHGG